MTAAAADVPEAIARDIQAIARLQVVPKLLRLVCELTGMGFAAVARVTDGNWTACAVHDAIAFGLLPGGQLDVHTTLCKEVRAARAPVAFDQASCDAVYSQHATPRLYHFESYISVPIVLGDDAYFGNLCALDPRPVKVSDPRTVTLFTLFADLIAAQLEVERRRDAERAEGQLREQFMAILSHDLRNPLNAAAMSAHALRMKAGDDASRALADAIVRNVRRMAGLIDDTLDLTRSRLGGGIVMRPGRVSNLGHALREVAAELEAAHPGRTIACTLAIDRPVQCDQARVQQLVSNLLANALTHGRRDTPVQLDARLDGAGMLVIRVTNQGEPIAPRVMQNLFEPFRRGGDTADAQGGLGLGLYICTQIAQAHGGRLDVASDAHETVFTVHIPA